MSTMVTVKRNGVYIVFPQKSKAPIKGEMIEGVSFGMKKAKRPAVALKNMEWNYSMVRASVIKSRKRCMRCGDLDCFYGSAYCWECYKYEHYESK